MEQKTKAREQEFVEFECPQCNEELRAHQSSSGKKGTCPKCRNIIRIPRT